MSGDRSVVLIHGVSSSHLTWWRNAQDLTDLHWRVQTVDLLGHGDRADRGPADLRVEDLARDVLEQVTEPVDLVVGHSLGAIVALTALTMAPQTASTLVLEDPPASVPLLDLRAMADQLAVTVEETRQDPQAATDALLRENPLWSVADAASSVQNRMRLDVERVGRLLRTADWDLPALVAGCPVPPALIAATRGSALVDPDRATVTRLVGEDRVGVVDSGHDVHRDRPALWLHEVLRLAGDRPA